MATKEKRAGMDCVYLDNLSDTANRVLNVLWDRNDEMSMEELLDAVNTEFHLHKEKSDITEVVRYLVRQEYIEKKRHGLKVRYIALGAEIE